MSVCFWTSDGATLLESFDKRISQKEPKGKITTWIRVQDGKYYTHAAEQWKNKAFFKATVEDHRLVFNIVKPKGLTITTTVYGYYHGHLTETFLNHFDDEFSTADSTARCVQGDVCG